MPDAAAARTAVRRVAAPVVVIGVLLAGCASVPSSGEVHQARAEGTDTDAQREVQFYPEPPEPGATPDQIVRGFLDASGAVEPASAGLPSLATARLYLTPDQQSKWHPESRVTIIDSFETVARGDTVDFDATLAGQVDAGAYVATAEGDHYHRQFDVSETEVQGGTRELRIQNPPPELLISKSNFDREFAPLMLYFLDPSQRVLVPQPVYLPNRADRATLLVQLLLTGPNRWLSAAVTSALPAQTGIGERGVRVSAGAAVVDLTGPAGKTSERQRELFAAQLVWTLAQLQIRSVSITVDGKDIGLPAELDTTKVKVAPAGGLPSGGDEQVDAYALRDGQLNRLPGFGTTDARPPEKVAGAFGGQDKVSDFAIQPTSPSGSTATVAGIDPSGTKLYIAEGVLQPRLVFSGDRLASPTWDRFGWLWVVNQKGRSSVIVVVDPKERSHVMVSAPMLAAGSLRVDAIAVSQDGTRLAMVTRNADGLREAQIASVIRTGRDVELGQLQPLAPGLAAYDIAWRGNAELALLGKSAGQRQVYIVSVDGSGLEPQGTVEGANSVAAATGRPLLVGTAGNRVWQQSTVGSWEPVQPSNLSVPQYPG